MVTVDAADRWRRPDVGQAVQPPVARDRLGADGDRRCLDGAVALSNSEVTVNISREAGKSADPSILVNVPKLVTAYYVERPDPDVPAQQVAFGTSGHRGSAFNVAFNE